MQVEKVKPKSTYSEFKSDVFSLGLTFLEIITKKITDIRNADEKCIIDKVNLIEDTFLANILRDML